MCVPELVRADFASRVPQDARFTARAQRGWYEVNGVRACACEGASNGEASSGEIRRRVGYRPSMGSERLVDRRL